MKPHSSNSTSGQSQIGNVDSQKNIGLAILFTLFLGPLGMLYSTITGAIVMFFVNMVMLFFTAGFGLLFTWPIGIVWAAIAARTTHIPSREGNYPYN